MPPHWCHFSQELGHLPSVAVDLAISFSCISSASKCFCYLKCKVSKFSKQFRKTKMQIVKSAINGAVSFFCTQEEWFTQWIYEIMRSRCSSTSMQQSWPSKCNIWNCLQLSWLLLKACNKTAGKYLSNKSAMFYNSLEQEFKSVIVLYIAKIAVSNKVDMILDKFLKKKSAIFRKQIPFLWLQKWRK